MKLKLLVIGLLIIGIVGGGLFYQQQLLSVDPANKTQVAIVIPKAQAAGVTIEELSAKKIIKSSLAAKIYLRVTGFGSRIQSGTFLVSASQSVPEIINTLSQKPKDVWVTIPEGWRREQIADRFAAELAGVGGAFSKEEFLTLTLGLEGQLFPDTYLVPRNSTASDIKKYLLNNFSAKAPGIDKETLILASLVEREGKTDADRPVIAGILQNRLQAGWPLQVDATLQYTQGNAANWWPSNLNTKLPSIYNTYLHPGLPPAPIANPGLAAINAALHPETSNYWYYIHDTDGVVHYAATLSEHNSNIDKYLNP